MPTFITLALTTKLEPHPCAKRPRTMTIHTIIDIPQRLGSDEAKRRMVHACMLH